MRRKPGSPDPLLPELPVYRVSGLRGSSRATAAAPGDQEPVAPTRRSPASLKGDAWEAAFDRLTEDLDPYHEFLRYGYLTAYVDDADEWRSELRRQARRDKIPFSSLTIGRNRAGLYHVWAGRKDRVTYDSLRETMALVYLQEEASESARTLGHPGIVWLRSSHGEEAAGRCTRCGARAYVSRLESPPIVAGDAFEEECSR